MNVRISQKEIKIKHLWERAFRRDSVFPGIGDLAVYFDINPRRGLLFQGALD